MNGLKKVWDDPRDVAHANSRTLLNPEFAEIAYKYSIRHMRANARTPSREDIVRVYEKAREGRLESIV
jgi:hypothetical protein